MPELPEGIAADVDIYTGVTAEQKAFPGGSTGGRIATGNPEGYAAEAAANQQTRDIFYPVFDQIGITDDPGTMRELRNKLMNDLSQEKFSDLLGDVGSIEARKILRDQVMNSLKEFQSSGEMGELKGKGFTQQHIDALVEAAIQVQQQV